MPTKIFVGKLAEGISSEDIRSLFRKFGVVTECDVLSNYGFVVSTCTIIFIAAYFLFFYFLVFFVFPLFSLWFRAVH